MSDLELNFTNHSDNGTELVANTGNSGEWKRDYILQLRTFSISPRVTAIRATGGGSGTGLHGLGGPGGGAGVIGNAGGRAGVTGVIGLGSPTAGVGVHGFGSADVDRGGKALGIGVRGISTIGVVGMVNDIPLVEEPCGIFGTAVSTGGYTGIVGRSDLGIGIEGTSSSGTGVQGRSGGGIGVRGVGGSGSARGAGMLAAVVGDSPFGGIGIRGSGNIGSVGLAPGAVPPAPLTERIGVFGSSPDSVGVSGVTYSGTAVLGVVSRKKKKGFRVPVPGPGMAGHFMGPVLVQGSLTVTGAKSAAVPGSNGKHKVLYCVESTEAWFEDFGEAKLKNGSVNVSIPKDFAALILKNNYHVFLTSYGPCNGLFVAKRSQSGFVVREANGGTSSVLFSFRIVAKRKDISAPRLHEVNMPSIPAVPRPSKKLQPKAAPIPKVKKGTIHIRRKPSQSRA
jgi:hypothetical protein